MDYVKDLGRWALIVGGSTTIGEQFVRQTAGRGMNVVLVARRAPLLESIAEDIRRQHGVEARPLPMDLLEEGAVERLAQAVRDLDIGLVVVNANMHKVGYFADMPLETKLAMLRMNAQLPLELAHAFLPRMAEAGRGGLLFVNVVNALAPMEIDAVFQGTKAFLLLLVESLWAEYRKQGVKIAATMVNGIEGSESYEAKLSDRSRIFAKYIGGSMDPARIVKASLEGFAKDYPIIVPDYRIPINRVAFSGLALLRLVHSKAATLATSGLFSALLDGDEVQKR